MNNPFINLRKFQIDNADPKENHATESLAACLQFSPAIREAFVRFLFGDSSPPFPLERASEITVVTQENIGAFGIIDLFLSIPEEINIVVEVKVGAAEDAVQLRKYRTWLNQQKASGFLFSLVRDPNKDFSFSKNGVLHRRTWKELYDAFSDTSNKWSETEQQIVALFIEFLEIEGIVTTWNPAQLTGFGAGSVARKALSMLFQSLSERLPADVFETKLVMPESAWPRLEIGKKGWERIFGDGYNYNVFLWFKVPGIWDATEHSFYPEIQLWTKNHGNDWNATRPKLMAWTKTLAKANFSHWVDGRGFPGHFDLTQQEIVGVPRRILATLDDLKIDEATLRTLTDHELILALEKMVIRYCDAVEQLG